MVLGDDDLAVDLLEVRDVGDDADEAVALGQLVEGLEGLLQGVVVEGSEAFVDEHGVELNAACRLLYLIGKAEGEGQGGLELLAAGE